MYSMKEKTCCFTGHRPQKLPWGVDEQDSQCIEMKDKIKMAIIKAIEDGYEFFISGMALGCDTYFSEIVLKLRSRYPHIKLECAIPYEEQSNTWKAIDRDRYFKIIENSDTETLLSHNYYRGCFMVRNQFMINKSSLLISTYIEGEKSGTKNIIEYAQKSGMNIIYLLV